MLKNQVPLTERLALRNALAVFTVFAGLKGLRSLRRKKAPSKAGAKKSSGWDEALKTTIAAGLTAEVFSRGQTLTGSSVAGGLLSIVPLRLFCDNNAYHFNYRFIVSYITAQVLVSKLPKSRLTNLIIMMVSASQLLGWWLISDEHLPVDYMRFLDREGKVDRTGVRDEDMKVVGSQLKGFRRVFRNEDGKQTWSELIHHVLPRPGRGSLAHNYNAEESLVGFGKATAEYLYYHFIEAWPFYAKIYALRFVASLLRRKKVKAPTSAIKWTVMERIAIALAGDPNIVKVGENLLSLVKDITRSAAFLSSYCTIGMWSIGVAAKVMPSGTGPSPSSPAMWLWLSLPGLAILLESESQQTTIANYCATFGFYPLLACYPPLFDVTAAVTAAACSSDLVPRPALLSLLWPADPAGARLRAQQAAIAATAVARERGAVTPPDA